MLKVLVLIVLFLWRFGNAGYSKNFGNIDDNYLGIGTIVG
jgi:hypothetical protein